MHCYSSMTNGTSLDARVTPLLSSHLAYMQRSSVSTCCGCVSPILYIYSTCTTLGLEQIYISAVLLKPLCHGREDICLAQPWRALRIAYFERHPPQVPLSICSSSTRLDTTASPSCPRHVCSIRRPSNELALVSSSAATRTTSPE
jgi:hypothetical protein